VTSRHQMTETVEHTFSIAPILPLRSIPSQPNSSQAQALQRVHHLQDLGFKVRNP
jgi:hypothetical protein